MPHFKILKGGEDDLLKLPISMVADFFGENKNVSKWGIQFLHVKWLKLPDFLRKSRISDQNFQMTVEFFKNSDQYSERIPVRKADDFS